MRFHVDSRPQIVYLKSQCSQWGPWIGINGQLAVCFSKLPGKLAQWRVADPVAFYTRTTTIIFVISGYVKLVTLYCHAIFWETEGLGKGCVKIMQIVPCLELMTNLFIFIHNGGNEKLLYGPTEKWCSFFWYESFSKGCNVLNEFRFQSHMRFCLTQLSATRFYGSLSVYSHPLS